MNVCRIIICEIQALKLIKFAGQDDITQCTSKKGSFFLHCSRSFFLDHKRCHYSIPFYFCPAALLERVLLNSTPAFQSFQCQKVHNKTELLCQSPGDDHCIFQMLNAFQVRFLQHKLRNFAVGLCKRIRKNYFYSLYRSKIFNDICSYIVKALLLALCIHLRTTPFLQQVCVFLLYAVFSPSTVSQQAVWDFGASTTCPSPHGQDCLVLS